jgi:hypothetical protein
MKWIYNDGGREAAGFKGTTGDCVCRAFAIASGKPYKEVYDDINRIAKGEKTGKHKKGKSSARTGVYRYTERKLASEYGFEWVPTMKIGEGCKVHLKADELPKGTIIVQVTSHLVCVKDGVIYDTFNSSIKKSYNDEGVLVETSDRRCVYGYYIKVE